MTIFKCSKTTVEIIQNLYVCIFKDNFVDKNLNILPKGIDDLFQDLGISKRSSANNKSTTFILKTGTNELIKNLSETVSSF